MRFHRVFLPILAALTLAALPAAAQSIPAWRTIGNLTEPRAMFSALEIGDGQVLVMGGYALISVENSDVATATCEIIDAARGAILPTGSMLKPRGFFTALLVPEGDGDVVVLGGDMGRSLSSVVTGDVELYDHARKVWRKIGVLHTPRYQHAAVFINDHEILVAGGRKDGGETISDCEIFDIKTGTSRPAANLPFRSNGAALDLSFDGIPTLVGYRTGGSNSERSSTVYAYDAQANVWKYSGGIADAVQKPEMLKLWDGRLLISGGAKTDAPFVLSRDLHIEDGPGVWRKLGQVAYPRLWSSVAQYSTDQALIIGGYDVTEKAVQDVDIVDLQTGTVTAGPKLASPRKFFTAVSVPVLWGEVAPLKASVVAISGYSNQSRWTSTVELLDGNCYADVGPGGDIEKGESYQLWASAPDGSTYDWRPAIGLNCTDCAQPVASPSVTTTYIVTVKNPGGCTIIDTVTVRVRVAASVALGASVSSVDGVVRLEGSGAGTRFTLSRPAHVTADVYAPNGARVTTLLDASFDAGAHRLDLSVADLPAGVYFLRLVADGSVAVRKIVEGD